ncbi:MAG: site-specific DNA-methyltransferase [Treponema bryantii]|jgi:site-specific DNA-methyltransferase (adenine-specific)|nr:site-specific DNA-methyltransferase [Treponema bryantii]
MEKQRAERNRTLTLSEEEKQIFEKQIFHLSQKTSLEQVENQIIQGDLFETIDLLPENSVDLMIIDPPYNLSKNFNGLNFNGRSNQEYIEYLESWFPKVIRLLKKDASLYICGDWKCSAALYEVTSKYLKVRNRITWQREKGRGASSNWKNCTEDIWFATVSDEYYFDVNAVKQKKRVIAPYKQDGKPKDWQENDDGKYRLTCPSNFWDDISIPFWSMPENTDHPTQKPEKLIAKLILASSAPNAVVFDPFLGSGTTAVTAAKLGRRFFGIELNTEYCMWALKRLERAKDDKSIQGYEDGIFYERNMKN